MNSDRSPVLTADLWQEIDLFFMQQGRVYETLSRLKERLTQLEISYAVIKGMALVLHGYRRLTEDVDLLLTPEGLSQFQQQLEGRGYIRAFPGAQKTFKDAATGIRVEIITTGEFPGDGQPKAVIFPDPIAVAVELEGIQVVDLKTLIELKLASGLSAPDRLKDLADVQELIRVLQLDRESALQLDASVREEYLRLWSAVDSARQRDLDCER
jgi:hypothetical protein